MTWSTESDTRDYLSTHEGPSAQEWTPEDDYETGVTDITEPHHTTLVPRSPVARFDGPRMLTIAPDSSFSLEVPLHLESVLCSDYTFFDMGTSACQSEHDISPLYRTSLLDLFRLELSRPFSGSHHSSIYAESSEPGISGTAYFYSTDDVRTSSLRVLSPDISRIQRTRSPKNKAIPLVSLRRPR